MPDRKSTRLNSSHLGISYAVFCLKKKKKTRHRKDLPMLVEVVSTCMSVVALCGCVGGAAGGEVWCWVLCFLVGFFFFFLNDRAPPEIYPFPLPGRFPD